MGRSPCCDKVGLKKGPWTPEEDQKLLAYIEEHGHGSWRALPAKAGLQRCGKSCRLRWTNYLRPDIKRGKFSLQEEQTIIQLHALLGNRWSAIATYLPKRTDNEIKNYWNTHLKKRLTKMGIDPVTHKPKSDTLGSGQSKDAANLSHMAQWESARLEAEARLVRESKLLVCNVNLNNHPYQSQLGSTQLLSKAMAPPPLCLDVLKVWQGGWGKMIKQNGVGGGFSAAGGCLESPTSTLDFAGNVFSVPTMGPFDVENIAAATAGMCDGRFQTQLDDGIEMENNPMHFHEVVYPNDGAWITTPLKASDPSPLVPSFSECYPDPLLQETYNAHNPSNVLGNFNNVGHTCGGDFEENKNYWNNMLNLVNSATPAGSSMF